jgi:arylsulfatase A-like enzyme
MPHPRFAGKSGMGPRGDVILQLDWSVGELLAALDRLDLSSRTLVIFTSDNGPVLDDGYQDRAVELADGHQPAGPFRGGKYSIFEGGSRVPFVVRWPGRVRPGISEALVSQVDLSATLAALTGVTLEPSAAPDSLDMRAALLGDSAEGRAQLVQHSAGTLALVRGPWKYIAPSRGAAVNQNVNIELGNDPLAQLYDLARDPGERNNLAAERPELVSELAAELERLRSAGRVETGSAGPARR